tara:strand:- start:273 stop:536 length:264 start_codon:yes stop_codon:yes gene_type:complete
MEMLKKAPNKGVKKLPTAVRNKMGFMKKGGKVAPKKMKTGGGLYANIHAKKARIAAGSKEKMRNKGDKGAPTDANFKRAAETAKKKK